MATHSFSLRDNAYRFLNHSLRHSRKASTNVHEWAFAIFCITQSIELLLKAVLRAQHPALIFEDLDNPRRTVNLRQALTRLETHAGLAIGQKEKHVIEKASECRNALLHFELTMNHFQLKNLCAQLFEFAHYFHFELLPAELHEHIDKDLWRAEARLMRYFKQTFVTYDGVEVVNSHPEAMLRAQRVTHFHSGRRSYARVRYGDEKLISGHDWGGERCHDCSVRRGQYHTDHCDVEVCPKCRTQLLSCDCFDDDFLGPAKPPSRRIVYARRRRPKN